MSECFYLLAENTFESCCFVSRFVEEFNQSGSFCGVISAEERPDNSVLERREQFHKEYARHTEWNEELDGRWSELYQPLNETSRRMIRLHGLPGYSVSHHANTVFLGSEINGKNAEACMSDLFRKTSPWLVTYLPRILKPWWIEISNSRVLNCHSAVLPYARGMYAIENVAALKDIEAFRRAVGVTVHFIDSGIDTGPIIRAERLAEPFRFGSIWELKGHLYRTGIECYIQIVKNIVGQVDTVPAGISPRTDLQGPNYLKKHFTAEKKKQAEEGYLWMKSQLSQCEPQPFSDASIFD